LKTLSKEEIDLAERVNSHPELWLSKEALLKDQTEKEPEARALSALTVRSLDFKPKMIMRRATAAAHKKGLHANEANHFYHPLLRTNPGPKNWPSDMTRMHIIQDDDL
jgi:hypothetical protein